MSRPNTTNRRTTGLRGEGTAAITETTATQDFKGGGDPDVQFTQNGVLGEFNTPGGGVFRNGTGENIKWPSGVNLKHFTLALERAPKRATFERRQAISKTAPNGLVFGNKCCPTEQHLGQQDRIGRDRAVTQVAKPQRGPRSALDFHRGGDGHSIATSIIKRGGSQLLNTRQAPRAFHNIDHHLLAGVGASAVEALKVSALVHAFLQAQVGCT